MGSEEEFDDFDEEVRQKPREMIMSSKHMTRVEINGPETIERYLSCPICLGLMRATTATECLHRFCSECIESAIRLGRKECPTCRAPIATRRALRRDLNFDNLVRSLYPDVDIEEEVEEMDISQYLFTAVPSPTPRSLFMGKDEKPPRTKHERLTSPVPAALPKSLATPVSETKRTPPAALEQWTCETCTLLNAGSARKCKACEAPNPNRPSRKRLKREKPTETALEVEQAEAEAPNGAEGGNPTQGSGAEERLVISEWKFANGLVPSPEPTKAASRPRVTPTGDEGSSGVGSRLPAGSVARQSDWDREIARAWERKRGLEQETHERRDERQRLRDSEDQSAFAAAKALVSDIGGSKRPAPLPTAPLDFDEKTMSIEAQLLVRGTFSLDIKHKGGEGIHAIWSYPTGNPGDCNAWVSIAPADRVAEANARQKYKLLTKNKVCGEVRCARDSAPPRFALAAWSRAQAQSCTHALARTTPYAHSHAHAMRRAPCTHTMHTPYAPTASPRSFSLADLKRLHDGDYGLALHATIAGQQKTLAVSSSFRLQGGVPTAEGGGSGIKVEQGDEEEEAAEAQGERPAGDEEAAADGEEGEEEGEAESRKASLPPNGRRRRGAPEAEAATGARGQRAGRQRAKGQGAGGERSRPRCWRPELSEEDAATVGLAVLGTLQRRGALRSEALLPLANAALPAMAVPVRVALLESLRLLVRCGYVLRERGGEGRTDAPSYALSPLAHEALQRVASAQGESDALPSEPQSARSPVTPELPPAAIASPHASTSTEPANGSKDTSAAGKVASGAEKAGGASGAPAKYRIKRRPKGESGDGDSASHADGEDAARRGGVASGHAASQPEEHHDPPRPPSQQQYHQQHHQQHQQHQPPPPRHHQYQQQQPQRRHHQHQQYQGGEHGGNRRFVGGDGAGGGGGYVKQGGYHPSQGGYYSSQHQLSNTLTKQGTQQQRRNDNSNDDDYPHRYL